MLADIEQRLSRLSRTAWRASAAAPDPASRVGDTIASALGMMARALSRAREYAWPRCFGSWSDDALRAGNNVLRRLTREVEHRPLVLLAVAAGVGLLVVDFTRATKRV